MSIFVRSAALAALLLFVRVDAADAQGKGRGLGRGKKDQPGQQSGGGEPEAAPDIPGRGIRNFGAWLDDATLVPPWRGWMTFGVGYWKSAYGHQWDAPSIDAGMGITPRLLVSVSAPVSRIEYTDGSEIHGLGDVYMAAKVGLVAPGENDRPWGLAVIPLVEVLSSGSVPEGTGRVHWGLPLTFEWRFSKARVYGSAGYFSRGAAFGAGALEVPLNQKFTLTGSLSHTRSLEEDLLADEFGLSRSRWDLMGTALYTVANSATVYLSVGRTISQFDANASSLAITAGASAGFQGRRVRR